MYCEIVEGLYTGHCDTVTLRLRETSFAARGHHPHLPTLAGLVDRLVLDGSCGLRLRLLLAQPKMDVALRWVVEGLGAVLAHENVLAARVRPVLTALAPFALCHLRPLLGRVLY